MGKERASKVASKFPAGWRFPGASRKAHAYDEGEIISLCGKWMFAGQTLAALDAKASPDDCAACRKILAKRVAKAPVA
jgi:hypothetical protein